MCIYYTTVYIVYCTILYYSVLHTVYYIYSTIEYKASVVFRMQIVAVIIILMPDAPQSKAFDVFRNQISTAIGFSTPDAQACAAFRIQMRLLQGC